MPRRDSKRPETKAILDNGDIVSYDAWGDKVSTYSDKYFELLGHGHVYSVDGHILDRGGEGWFFKAKSREMYEK